MNDPNSSNPASGRPTLKLKAAKKKSPTMPTPQPQNNSKSKPGAQWSDEHKESMQAEMDALARDSSK
jgi:hypothetical protein